MKKNIFITGATGFLGSHILKLLLQERDNSVYLLIRGKNKSDVERRCIALIRKIFKTSLDKQLLNRINVVNGDLEFIKDLCRVKGYEYLHNKIDEIYHCAAVTGFRVPLKIAQKVNVEGTENILDFVKEGDRPVRVNYISTAFIVGNKECVLTEDDLDIGQKFNNAYEQSKFEAELLIQKYRRQGIRISIFRPSIIVGDYYTGKAFNFKLLYSALQLLSLELFDEFPAYLNAKHNLIPVDMAAKAIYLLANNEKNENTYHIFSQNDILCYDFMEFGAKFFGYNNPAWIPLEKFDFKRLSFVQKSLIEPFVPYFNYKAVYSAKKTELILEKLNFRFPIINEEFLHRLFQFCLDSGFIKRHQKL